jgi:hypothetical protein
MAPSIIHSLQKGHLILFSSILKKIAAAEGGEFKKIKKLKEQKG